jgi:hypothetical protein
MANTHYTARNLSLTFCPAAVITGAIGPLDTLISVTGLTSPSPNDIRLGSAAMIGEEIVAIVSQAGSDFGIARGCGDTIPASHGAGTTIWFFDDFVATDGIEYAGNETIGVKPLPETLTGGSVPIAYSPPEGLTFNYRFPRPYPPAQVEANGSPWFNLVDISGATTQLDLTWVHRNRVTQMDLLVDHTQANVTPEVGQTYTVRVYDDLGVLKATHTGIAAMSWQYSVQQMTSDFAAASTPGVIAGYLMFVSVREGYESLQPYRIDFTFESRSPVSNDFTLSFDIQSSVVQDFSFNYDILN